MKGIILYGIEKAKFSIKKYQPEIQLSAGNTYFKTEQYRIYSCNPFDEVQFVHVFPLLHVLLLSYLTIYCLIQCHKDLTLCFLLNFIL